MPQCRVCQIEYKAESLKSDITANKKICRSCRTEQRQTTLQQKQNSAIYNEVMALEARVNRVEETTQYIDTIVEATIATTLDTMVESFVERLVNEKATKLTEQIATLNSRVLALTNKLQKLEE
jgi:hypothetical protein|tara:strand:+ start:7128 stop:7496 length:369 start_codon:yes stop_codon:yes gene_type:complete